MFSHVRELCQLRELLTPQNVLSVDQVITTHQTPDTSFDSAPKWRIVHLESGPVVDFRTNTVPVGFLKKRQSEAALW